MIYSLSDGKRFGHRGGYLDIYVDQDNRIMSLYTCDESGERIQHLSGWTGRILPTMWKPVVDPDLIIDEGL